ncbi:MAG: glycosyltransferase [Methylomicrobium sp.]|nr:glycosyltransferase [Methylomicrobium sp.]
MISFIVPPHNHLQQTQEILSSLLTSLPVGLDFEVILVDDASNDATPKWLSRLRHPRMRALINSQNLGYAATNNRAVDAACGEILCLLNNDLIFSPGWLEPMLHLLLDSEVNIGIVGNVQRRVADGEIDHAGVKINPKAQFEHIQSTPTDTSYAFFKVRKAGKAVVIAYESVIRHHVSLSRGVNSLQNERNSCLLFARWRDEIKKFLTQAWLTQLTTDAAKQPWLDGVLAENFIRTPHVASLMLAENRLTIQDQRWAFLLRQKTVHEDLEKRFAVSGVSHETNGESRLTERKVCLSFRNCKAMGSFNLCGRILSTLPVETSEVVIDCNGLHSKHFKVKRGVSFNLVMDQPLVLSCESNVFQVTFDLRKADTASSVLLDYVVIDGHRLQL